MLPHRIPEFKRRALRLALGVFIPCFFGFGILVYEHSSLALSAQNAAKWAAISATVVGSQTIIGKASQVGFERILGTILGGFLGFIVHTLGAEVFFDDYSDGTYLAISAAIFAGLSIIVGHIYKLETSARLFTITFLLITFAGDAGQATWHIALVRVTGILLGVVIMLLLSVICLPKSATVQCLHDVDTALDHLHYLHALTFHDVLPSLSQEVNDLNKKHREDGIGDGGILSMLLNNIGNSSRVVFDSIGGNNTRNNNNNNTINTTMNNNTTTNTRINNTDTDTESSMPLLMQYSTLESNTIPSALGRTINGFLDPGAEHEERCDMALTGVYSSLFDLQTNIGHAKSEALIGVWNGHVIMAPRMPLSTLSNNHLPWEGLNAVSLSIRKTARRLFALGQALDAGEASALRRAIPRSGDVVEEVARAGHAAILSLRDAFPTSEGISSKNILRYIQAVERFERCGNNRMRELLCRSRRYQLLKLAWEELANSVKRSQGGGSVVLSVGGSGSSGNNNNNNNNTTTSTTTAQSTHHDNNNDTIDDDDESIYSSSFLEWQSLAFLITDLGTDIVTLHFQLIDVMKNLPYHRDEYRMF